jgi:predicted PurR-regulated permease PerM
MNFIIRYKQEILIALSIIAGVACFIWLYGIFLPFFLGLLLAFAVNPIIAKIQTKIKKRNLATSLFLFALVLVTLLSLFLFGHFINRDFQRMNQSFQVLVSENQENLEKTALKAKAFLGEIYDFEALEEMIYTQMDSITNQVKTGEELTVDTESIRSSLEMLLSVFHSGEEEEPNSQKPDGFGLLYILFSTVAYFFLILYSFEYFQRLKEQYFIGNIKSKSGILLEDFKKSFGHYFRLRSKIVWLLALIYLIGFILLDMPGVLLLTVLIIFLSYVPYLQYIALIPVAIGCLVLSVENEPGFLFYFGIATGLFLLASIIEEAFLNPWIMEKNIGMNIAIMVLGITLWTHLFGMIGTLIAVPLTSLIIIYIKRFILSNAFLEPKEDPSS